MGKLTEANPRYNTQGFTIVELLIVIVVIAVLAAISIVAYNGIQNRANDVAIQSDLGNLKKKLEVFKLSSSSEQYPTNLTASALDPPAISKNAYGNHYLDLHNLLYCRMPDGQNYALAARSTSGITFAVTSTRSVYVSNQQLTTGGTQCAAEGASGADAWWTYSNGAWRL